MNNLKAKQSITRYFGSIDNEQVLTEKEDISYDLV